MDSRTNVHPKTGHDESSEEEERLSPAAEARSTEDDVDSDKSFGHAKKRKRGSYRCSRCGMPKRGHNCPDNYEGVHFAILDNPNSTNPSAISSLPVGPTPVLHLGAPLHSLDECSKETLLMHLSALHDENLRLCTENSRLHHELMQFQAHAFGINHGANAPDFNRSLPPSQQMSRPAVLPPQMLGPPIPTTIHRGSLPSIGGGGAPLFANTPGFVAQGHVRPSVQPVQSQQGPNTTATNAASLQGGMPASRNYNMPPQGAPSSPPRSQTAPTADSTSVPPAKRVKLEESAASNNFSAIPFVHGAQAPPQFTMAAGHGPHHFEGLPPHSQPHLPHPAFASRPLVSGGGDMHASQYDYDYDHHDWWETDSSSTSDYMPSLDASPPVMY